MNDLVFHTAYGTRVAEAAINGEERAFGATIVKQDGDMPWRLAVYTHGLVLITKSYRTLAEARAEANSCYAIVEDAATYGV